MRLFYYQSEEDLYELSRDVRFHPLSEEKIYMDLGGSLVIHCNRARALVNAKIFQVLDIYKVPKKIRHHFVFEESYRKGQPEKYMNRIAPVLRDDKLKIPQKEIVMYWILGGIKSCFFDMSLLVNGVITVNHSLVDYVLEYQNNPEFRDIIDKPHFFEDSNPYEVRDWCDKMRSRFKDEIRISPMYDFFVSGTKINEKQVQMFIKYGLPPNYTWMWGTLPPINEGLLNGFRQVHSQHVLDQIARLTQIAGKSEVKEVGTVTKRVSVVADPVKLNYADTRQTVCDCGNPFVMYVTIKDKKDLQYYRGKEIWDPDTHKQIGTIDLDRTDLIGTKVGIRTFMTCRGDIICEHCFGYNHAFLSDTPLFKVNLNTFMLQKLSDVMQGVISIKHFTTAILKPIQIAFGEDIQMSLVEFLGKYDYITDLKFDKILVNPKYSFEIRKVVTGSMTKKRKKRDRHGAVVKDEKERAVIEKVEIPVTHYEVYIDGKKLSFDQPTFFLLDEEKRPDASQYWFRVQIPNDSVLIRGKDLKQAINSHSNQKNGDFDQRLLYSGKLSLIEQVQMIYEYIKTKIKMDHFIYYEALVCSLIRDFDDLGSQISETTTQVKYIHANQALTKPEVAGKTIATKLIHGYVQQNMNVINSESEASEMDILYQNIKDRSIYKHRSNEMFLNIIQSLGSHQVSDQDLETMFDG